MRGVGKIGAFALLSLASACHGTTQVPDPQEASNIVSPMRETGPFATVAGGTPASAWDQSMQSLADELAQRLRWGGPGRLKIAVLDFVEAHGRTCSLGAPAAEDLTTSLFDTDKFDIIERRMLDRVLRENSATQSDLYDPQQVARLGGLLGAAAIITGTVSASDSDYSFNARVILVESGAVASAARIAVPFSQTTGRGTCGNERTIIAAPRP